jgi:stage V sporulation protein SpoVS
MAELLKCRSCHKKSAFVTTKGKLEKLTNKSNSGDNFFKAGAVSGCVSGAGLASIQAIPLEALIDLVKTVFNKAFGWFEDSNKKYIVCRDCGHYELVD